MTLTLEQKKEKLKQMLRSKTQLTPSNSITKDNYKTFTYDNFMQASGQIPEEAHRFFDWVTILSNEGKYPFESARTTKQTSSVSLVRETGETMNLINLSSYNYLGLGYHPQVIKAAQDAVAQFGLGANSSPIISGTYTIHKALENSLLEYFALPDRGISLFTSGYSVNLGVIQAYIKPGHYVVCDSASHMSIIEGATLSGGEIKYFLHNDMNSLEQTLQEIYAVEDKPRILICAEGLYSTEGDYGDLKGIVTLAKKYNAATLVDEAHSVLVCGENGRGVAEMQGVLEEIDLYVMTFSKAISGVGGALLAKKSVAKYVNWYAKCRMFSCALDPAVAGGMTKAIQIAMGSEGAIRRKRLWENSLYLYKLLEEHVQLGINKTWIITVRFANELNTIDLNDFLQRHGLDTSILQFPAVPKNEAKVRLFVTSEHTHSQLEQAAEIILAAARKFNFMKVK